MSKMNAWLLDLGTSGQAAVGTRELLHVIDAPAMFEIPVTPAYCQRVVFWQDRMLPVLDVAAKLGETPENATFLAVVGYQQQRRESPQFGALVLASPPRQLSVTDEQACFLPEQNSGWSSLAHSCFEYQGSAVPILNLRRIFTTCP